MPITPSSAPCSSKPQNSTPSRISRRNSSRDMYGSFQRSRGITPLYACAPSLMICQIASKSLSLHFRIMCDASPCSAVRNASAVDAFLAQRLARYLREVLKEIADPLRLVLGNSGPALSHIAERTRASDGSDRRNRPAAPPAPACDLALAAVAPGARGAELGMHVG